MSQCTITITGGEPIRIPVLEGQSVLSALRSQRIYISAPCGGNHACGKCRIRVLAGFLAPSDADRATLTAEDIENGVHLACAAFPTENITLELPRGEESMSTVTGFFGAQTYGGALTLDTVPLPRARESAANALLGAGTSRSLALLEDCAALLSQGAQSAAVARIGGSPVYAGAAGRLYGVGVDIGTTTLGFAAVNLMTGETEARVSAVNRQREYGADVITRITNAGRGHLGALTQSVRGQILEGVQTLCGMLQAEPRQILRVAVAGNTTMLHLLLGLYCGSLANYPFTPVTLEPLTLAWRELFDGSYTAEVRLLPGIATYVGADIAAGILSTGLHRARKPALLLDIGTNGEMALCSNGKLLCTATAAGPAFEGGNITWGIGSVPGAISAAACEGGAFQVTTIDGRPPIGICGSGVIDIVYGCFRTGLMDGTGRLREQYRESGVPLARDPDGRMIMLTQKDVRELQLAKSAIRSGIDVLLLEAGLSYEDVDTLYLAGGFGYRINLESAAGIGLLPPKLQDRTVAVGNSSLGGAVRYLTGGCGEELNEILGMAREFGLSENPALQRPVH